MELPKIDKKDNVMENSCAMFQIREAVGKQMFFKIGVLKNFANFTGKILCWSLFYNKVSGLKRSATLLKRDSSTAGVLLVKFQKQPPEVFYAKRYSYKFHKIHRKTGLQFY